MARPSSCFRITLLLVSVSALGLGGCRGSAVHTDYAAFVREPRPSVVGADYRVAPPDELVVGWMDHDHTLMEYRVTVGPDGRVLLDGVGALPASGRTCAEL